MSAMSLIASGIKILGSAVATADSETTAVVFDLDGAGSNSAVHLPSLSNFDSSDRIVVVFDAHSAGTTSVVTFAVEDAEGVSGTAPAASAYAAAVGAGGYEANGNSNDTITNVAGSGTLVAAAGGDHSVIVGVRLQSDRPWLRCTFDLDAGTDEVTASCFLLAIPAAL